MTKNKIKIFKVFLLISFIIFVLLIAKIFVASEDNRKFNILIINRKNPIKAEKLARELAKTKNGILLSIKDLDVYGGHSRGWSSWILVNNKNDKFTIEEIEKELKRDISNSKKIELFYVLWRITKNKKYLVDLFINVKNGNNSVVAIGRRKLASSLARIDRDMSKKIGDSENNSIEITIEEFKKVIGKPQGE
jgi:predicted transcriptional regulator